VSNAGRVPCDQCGKPAIGPVEKVNVCIDCYSRWQAANLEKVRLLMTLQNQTMDEMDWMLGLPRSGPRYTIPAPSPVIASRGPMTFHNISVSNSVVGAINTGNVQRIDVNIDNIRQRGAGGEKLAEDLKQFTQAIVDDKQLPEQEKRDAIEQMAFVTDQVQTKPAERNRGVISAVLSGINTAVSASNGLVTLWQHLHPMLHNLLMTSP
jgi:hypothetical protein